MVQLYRMRHTISHLCLQPWEEEKGGLHVLGEINEPDESRIKIKKSGRGRKSAKLKRRQVTMTCTSCGFEGHNKKSCGRDDPTSETSRRKSHAVYSLRRTDNQRSGILLPHMPLTQETISEVCEPFEFPTQQSQVEQVTNSTRVPGPSSWEQLQQTTKSRVQIGGPSSSSGKKSLLVYPVCRSRQGSRSEPFSLFLLFLVKM